jgi:undecaprenyl-diphosphatase
VLLSYVAIRRRIHPWAIASVSGATALLVGISRAYLDQHWASDVLGGWGVGAAFGAGSCALYEWMSRAQSEQGHAKNPG